MSWQEANQRRQEERLEEFIEGECAKVDDRLHELGKLFKNLEFFNGVSKDAIEFEGMCMINKSVDSDYSWYCSKEMKYSGYISSVKTLSKSFIDKYQLDRLSNLEEHLLKIDYKGHDHNCQIYENDVIRRIADISKEYRFISSSYNYEEYSRHIKLKFGTSEYNYNASKNRNESISFYLKLDIVGLYDNHEILQMFFLIPTEIEKHFPYLQK